MFRTLSQKFNQVYLFGFERKQSNIVYSKVQKGCIESIEICQFVESAKDNQVYLYGFEMKQSNIVY